MNWGRMADDAVVARMRHALMLARRNLGQVWPNPAVGCVIVKNGCVIGTGWTARGGRPHAESTALAQAGAEARGATLYVTLEPCAHHGKTPPCAEAVIRGGIAQAVIACRDPDPRVNGKGIAALQQAGIEVIEGICRAEAEALNAGFFWVLRRGRPWVTLKLATDAAGRMIPPPDARFITGEAARAHGHLLRAENDAILTGIGTVLTDDPLLTCRLPGLADRSPQRVVMDRRGRLPAEARIHPAWVYATSPAETLSDLAARGITRLLVEAGPTLSAEFLEQNLADEVYWYRSRAGQAEGEAMPPPPPRFTRHRTIALAGAGNGDFLEIYQQPHEA